MWLRYLLTILCLTCCKSGTLKKIITFFSSFFMNFFRYFQAVVPNNPSDRQIYRLDVRSSQQTCITCDLDHTCRYFNGIFSTNCSFYVLSCEGPQVPYTQLRASFNNTLGLFFNFASLWFNVYFHVKIASSFSSSSFSEWLATKLSFERKTGHQTVAVNFHVGCSDSRRIQLSASFSFLTFLSVMD